MEGFNEYGKFVKGLWIGILGVVYKKDVDDLWESLFFKLMEFFSDCGVIFSYFDLYIFKFFVMCYFDVFDFGFEEFLFKYF